MNIAFLTAANSWHIPVKTKYFVKNGHNVYYFGVQPGTDQNIIPKGVKCIDISSNKTGKLGLIDKILKVRKLTIEYKIDILHIIDMGYAPFILFSKAKKNVIENNGSDVLIAPKKKPILKFLYRFFYKFADLIVQDSKVAQNAGILYGASNENNAIIELGIDFDYFNLNVTKGIAKKKLKINPDQKIVFSPRGFTSLYNIDTIIKSIPIVKEKYKNVKYLFCRHFGELENEYKLLIKQLNVEDNVIFTGFLDNENDMPYFYADADVTISIPSSDSSPRSVYEALSCGCPIIVSILPWYEGKFEVNTDLLAIPQNDYNILANSIINVFDNKVMFDKIKIFNKIKSILDVNTHSQKLEQLYKKILKIY